VASSKGLVAAASPSELVIASTESIRNTWASGPASANNVKTFNPEAKTTVPRLSHVAFSADENVLVVAGEREGGLTVYQTDALTVGQIKPALEVSTNLQALRALAPNPNVQFTELFAAVTTGGELIVADLKAGQLRDVAHGEVNGVVLQRGVSSVAWSNQGKQLVAGRADGTVVQMTPNGTPKAEIPRPPSLEGEKHVSTLSWLSNDIFLIIYSFNSNPEDLALPSDYFIVTRQPKTQNYTFQALPEICPAFGLNRSPACQFVARMRNFEPHIEDLLLLASTTSFELGAVTKADAPMSREQPVTDTYTVTMPADDSRRAQLPLSSDGIDTSPIGLALDLSAKDGVFSPIPSDPEIGQSPGPLPNILALNQEGVLSSWWVVYADSIREKKTYSGLVISGGSEQTQKDTTSVPAQTVAPPPSGFGQPAFGQSGFGQSGFAAQQSFAKPATSTFGSGSDAKFGSPSPLSGDKPSWTSTGFGGGPSQTGSSGFGQPAFGTTTPVGGVKPAFGAPSPFAVKPAFGQPAAPATTSSSGTGFGQLGTLGPRNPNPFGGGGSTSPFGGSVGEGKGFASFSNKAGFSALGPNQTGQVSLFGKPTTKDSVFSQPQQPSPFGRKDDNADGKSAFPSFRGNGFSLGSTFKPDETSKNDLSKPDDTGGLSFGGGLGDALEQTQKEAQPTQNKEEEMDEDGGEQASISHSQEEPAPLPPDPKPQMSVVTPPSTISQPKVTPAPPLAGLFSTDTQPGTTPAAVQNSKPGWSFQQTSSTTPKETPKAKPFFPATPKDEDQPSKIKTEPPSGDSSPDLQNIPEAPLPPDSTSKPRFIPGDTTEASDESKLSTDDAPLPPDFAPRKSDSPSYASQTSPNEDEGEDFLSDFEGSVEDETQEISPVDQPTGDHAEQIQTSPESSFGKGAEGSEETSPAGGLFTKVSTSQPSKLFGEVTGPILPPPVPQESPRSPSPVRNVLTADLMRPESSRSVSAPARPHSASALDRRRAELTKSALATQSVNASEVREKEMGRTAAAEKAKAKAEAEATLRLEDDEDARLRAELEAPTSPSDHLEPFVPHQHNNIDSSNKSGIPGQIERLYRDINCMIDTLGINARSLSAHILYQTSQEPYKEWPTILRSETPRDALNDEWVLQDIARLEDGEKTLNVLLERSRIDTVSTKFEQCQELLNRDVVQLRMKLTSTRKALHAKAHAQGRLSAPLSAEQASLQHDLRKASMLVQSKLVEAEQELTVLRAKLAEARPTQENGINGTGGGMLGRSGPQKKPTVEAVKSTIAKMTSMAEKKSTDIDVLESQLKNLGLGFNDSAGGSRHGSTEPNGTPQRGSSGPEMPLRGRTPLSAAGSVYHTPDSKFGESSRSTPAKWRRSLRASVDGNGALVSTEDSERWKQKARKKEEVHRVLADALSERRKSARTAKA
jgi:nucleoporin NUP159